MKQQTLPEEMDLMILFAKMYRVFRNNKLLAIGLPALGLIGGIIIRDFSTDTVKTSMMVATTLTTENEAKFLVEQFEKADIPEELSRNQKPLLKGLHFEAKKGDVDDENIYLEVTTIITDKKILPVLEHTIVHYINQSEPVVRRRKEKEIFYNEMIKKIDAELTALENVKKELNNKTKASFLNPADLFSKTVELFEDKVTFQIHLEDIKSVHVVKGFDSMTKKEKWPAWAFALIGAICGFFIFCVISFAKFFASYYKQFENQTTAIN